MSTTLAVLMDAAYRAAGLLHRPGWTLGTDYYTADIPVVNRMFGSWNCDGHKIFTTTITDPLPLTAGQKTYTIGTGGDFDVERPMFIRGANILLPTTPVVRRPVHILDDDQWRSIRVQDIPGAPPYQLYYDGGNDADNRGQIYLRFQPPAGYSLELYVWLRLKTSFTAITDAVILPDGYEEAIVWNLALRLAGLYPNEANLSPMAVDQADKSLRAILTLNTRSPRITPDPALAPGDPGTGYGWLDGGIE